MLTFRRQFNSILCKQLVSYFEPPYTHDAIVHCCLISLNGGTIIKMCIFWNLVQPCYAIVRARPTCCFKSLNG